MYIFVNSIPVNLTKIDSCEVHRETLENLFPYVYMYDVKAWMLWSESCQVCGWCDGHPEVEVDGRHLARLEGERAELDGLHPVQLQDVLLQVGHHGAGG